ncbi:polysaccharide pyruvyl transferase family protein [Synechococcus sp. N32]|uniref:polysaccharide pyruvyl transferase family protein n=1 Tax=Synechococcus sp. N32 TaxID=2575514 RepID=UPI000E0F9220|nr:polysaccharide pyruvyl transferase family protein [Synechococcus sp. N32]
MQNIKTVELLNGYSLKNIGDEAIYYSIKELIPSECNIHCYLPEEFRKDGNLIFSNQKNESGIPKDIYISVGGDIFNNARKYLITKEFLKNAYTLRKYNKRAFLFGQSIPDSCQGIAYQYLVRCLKKLSNVVVRDDETYQRLKRSGVPVKLSFDTAFYSEVCSEAKLQAIDIFKNKGLSTENSLVISVRNFNKMYRHDNQKFLNRLTKLIDLAHKDHIDCAILIHSNVDTNDNDQRISKILKQKTENLKIINPFDLSKNNITPHKLAMAILENSRYILGVRYHTSVLSLASGRLPYNLYYSNKGKDLSERLSIPGSSIDSFEPEKVLMELKKSMPFDFDCSKIKKQVKDDFEECFNNTIKFEA